MNFSLIKAMYFWNILEQTRSNGIEWFGDLGFFKQNWGPVTTIKSNLYLALVVYINKNLDEI